MTSGPQWGRAQGFYDEITVAFRDDGGRGIQNCMTSFMEDP